MAETYSYNHKTDDGMWITGVDDRPPEDQWYGFSYKPGYSQYKYQNVYAHASGNAGKIEGQPYTTDEEGISVLDDTTLKIARPYKTLGENIRPGGAPNLGDIRRWYPSKYNGFKKYQRALGQAYHKKGLFHLIDPFGFYKEWDNEITKFDPPGLSKEEANHILSPFMSDLEYRNQILTGMARNYLLDPTPEQYAMLIMDPNIANRMATHDVLPFMDKLIKENWRGEKRDPSTVTSDIEQHPWGTALNIFEGLADMEYNKGRTGSDNIWAPFLGWEEMDWSTTLNEEDVMKDISSRLTSTPKYTFEGPVEKVTQDILGATQDNLNPTYGHMQDQNIQGVENVLGEITDTAEQYRAQTPDDLAAYTNYSRVQMNDRRVQQQRELNENNLASRKPLVGSNSSRYYGGIS